MQSPSAPQASTCDLQDRAKHSGFTSSAVDLLPASVASSFSASAGTGAVDRTVAA